MRKLLIVPFLCLGLAGCQWGSPEATDAALEKAKVLYEQVQKTCGVALRLTDLVDVVTVGAYAGATATARLVCTQIQENEVFGLFGNKDECVAVVNGVCIRAEKD